MNRTSDQKQVICYAGGKSAGHILPCITRAREIVKRYPQYQFLFFTSSSPLDATVMSQSELPSAHIPLTLMNVPRANTWYRAPLFAAQLIYCFLKSAWYLWRKKPKQVVTTGSYIAIPVVLAARMLSIPVELHALDAVPGKALTFLTPFAQSVSIVFKASARFFPAHKCMTSQYPVRFTKHDRSITPESARQQLGLAPDKPTVFVLGGSQGSQFLNRCVQSIAYKLNTHGTIQMIHQTGAQQTEAVTSFYQTAGIEHSVFSYNDKLALCYQAADIVIARAGAGTLFECAFFNKKSIIIPLESATTSHQKDNARAIAQQYPALFHLFEQKQIEASEDSLFNLVQTIIAQRVPSAGLHAHQIMEQGSR